MPEGRRVYLIEPAGTGRADRVAVLEDAGIEVVAFETPRAFLDVASVVTSGCILHVRGAGDRPDPTELSVQRLDLTVIVMSTREGDVDLAVRSIKAGASDFLEMSCGPERLREAVAGALERAVGADLRDYEAAFSAARIAEMTSREREVLARLLIGGTNKTIGRELGISPRTVEAHRAHVMDRLGAHTLSDAVRMALAAGFPPAGPGASRLVP